MKNHLTYLRVEEKPKNKNEFAQLDGVTRIEAIREIAYKGVTYYILKYDGTKKERPNFLNEVKTKTYTHEKMLEWVRMAEDWAMKEQEKAIRNG